MHGKDTEQNSGDENHATPPRTPEEDEKAEQARRAGQQQRWRELTSPQVLLLLGAGVLAFAGLGMPVPHLHWLIGAGLGAGLFYAPRLPRFGVPGALALIALGAVLLAVAVAWLPHGFLPEPAPDSLRPNPELEEEVYPRKAFEIVVAGAAALMHGVLVLGWNLWGRKGGGR